MDEVDHSSTHGILSTDRISVVKVRGARGGSAPLLRLGPPC